MQQKGTHWFPGHMKKALREIKERMNMIDVVVEIVDARAPKSTKNPYLEEMTKTKKRVLVFSKKDLADLSALKYWMDYYKNLNYHIVVADLNQKSDIQSIIKVILDSSSDKFVKCLNRGMKPPAIRAMIIGIPNVGKSTLINRIAGKNKASAQNTPGHTRAQQWIKVSTQLELLDTPGVLPPNYEDQNYASNLALLGAMKDKIIPQSKLAEELLNLLCGRYSNSLMARYELTEDELKLDRYEIFKIIGRKRGILLPKGEIDIDRVEFLLLKEFKEGRIAKVVIDYYA